LSRKPVIVVGGPTASGKSSLALSLAGRFGGEIINADSMQVYRDLRILTARPDDAALAQAPHRLYGVFGTGDRCSAGQWRSMALAEIAAVHGAGRVPILVGGTGLYLRALMTGLHRLPAVPAEVREALNARLHDEGPAALHDELSRVDPESASRLNRADGQRVVRALEVFLHTGRSLADWQTGDTEAAPDDLRFLTLVALPEREGLYENIDRRFEHMIEEGAVDEAEKLLATNPPEDFPLLKAVGVPPIRRFLAGEIDRNRMIELGKRDSRRYAKRQMTWFRHQIIPEITLQKKLSEINEENIFSEISIFLLTD
jgi:tRNA dimethylallyltransferase